MAAIVIDVVEIKKTFHLYVFYLNFAINYTYILVGLFFKLYNDVFEEATEYYDVLCIIVAYALFFLILL